MAKAPTPRLDKIRASYANNPGMEGAPASGTRGGRVTSAMAAKGYAGYDTQGPISGAFQARMDSLVPSRHRTSTTPPPGPGPEKAPPPVGLGEAFGSGHQSGALDYYSRLPYDASGSST